jgi:hypothetical protein
LGNFFTKNIWSLCLNPTTFQHIILFPYFLYPLLMMAMTGSILMTVAIGLERYVAVHHPINYSRATTDANALKRRILKYLVRGNPGVDFLFY